MSMKVPKGKFISTIKVGEKGQIVIPKEVRDLFDIKPGDTLPLLADKKHGIAIVKKDGFLNFADSIFSTQENPGEAKE